MNGIGRQLPHLALIRRGRIDLAVIKNGAEIVEWSGQLVSNQLQLWHILRVKNLHHFTT